MFIQQKVCKALSFYSNTQDFLYKRGTGFGVIVIVLKNSLHFLSCVYDRVNMVTHMPWHMDVRGKILGVCSLLPLSVLGVKLRSQDLQGKCFFFTLLALG